MDKNGKLKRWGGKHGAQISWGTVRARYPHPGVGHLAYNLLRNTHNKIINKFREMTAPLSSHCMLSLTVLRPYTHTWSIDNSFTTTKLIPSLPLSPSSAKHPPSCKAVHHLSFNLEHIYFYLYTWSQLQLILYLWISG